MTGTAVMTMLMVATPLLIAIAARPVRTRLHPSPLQMNHGPLTILGPLMDPPIFGWVVALD